MAVTEEDVLQGISTSLDDVSGLIAEATDWARGRLRRKHGLAVEDIDEDDDSVRNGIIWRTRWAILTYDSSSGLRPSEVQEGSERIKFAGRSDTSLLGLLEEAKESIDDYGRQNAPGRQPRFAAINKQVGMTSEWPRNWPR